MDRQGQWSLSPAFDITYSYNPAGLWTGRHQMSMNGKRDEFTYEDFHACAKTASLKRGREKAIVEQVCEAVLQWPAFAADAGVPDVWAERIKQDFRLEAATTGEALLPLSGSSRR
jgi:serine/threonine-protein kinase HipA